MRVFKFGGASVKNAVAVKNVAAILKRYPDEDIVMVLSAMGKTTNGLEKVVKSYFFKDGQAELHLNIIKEYHYTLVEELFAERKELVFNALKELFLNLENYINEPHGDDFDLEYDQIVSYGELLSTCIMHHYLDVVGISNRLFDARHLIKTDNNFREGSVDWNITPNIIQENVAPLFNQPGHPIALTQGFLGSSPEGLTTTLGREGSDFTAAILAYALDATEMVIWKDVPGLLNADPKYFDDPIKIDTISFREAIELSYYGATIIHPKTIKPLQNKHIALRIKSFLDPDADGTIIREDFADDSLIPSFIFKVDQMLISILVKDFSFIAEHNLEHIFGIFARFGLRIHMMQNSAISFSVCVDNDPIKIPKVMEELKKDYRIRYNEGVELVTIRHYDQETINRVLVAKKVFMEQRSRVTLQMVIKDKE
ncbi:MAG: aspartate kinase [Bacteroidetes bacterium]|nr:aspartate kinase [Bacteroidota bacterium]